MYIEIKNLPNLFYRSFKVGADALRMGAERPCCWWMGVQARRRGKASKRQTRRESTRVHKRHWLARAFLSRSPTLLARFYCMARSAPGSSLARFEHKSYPAASLLSPSPFSTRASSPGPIPRCCVFSLGSSCCSGMRRACAAHAPIELLCAARAARTLVCFSLSHSHAQSRSLSFFLPEPSCTGIELRAHV